VKGAVIVDRLGVPGIIGAALLLFCVAFFLSAVLPVKDEIDDLRATQDRLAKAVAQADRPVVAAPTQALPSFANAPELLKQLYVLAERHGVTVARSSYQVETRDSTRRFRIDMPVRVAYPTLRAWLRDALALSPTASLDDLDLHRAAANDPALDADVRLSYSFAATP
jgi:hypothetical protein